jgi:hypothetical protein
MTSTDILAWHDFFVTMAQVGATLAGLLFVGLTISLGHMLQGSGYLARAFAALYLQLETLLIGLAGLIPGQPAAFLGVELIVIGLALLAGITTFARNFPEDEHSHVLGSRGPRMVRAVLTYAATLSPVIAGSSLVIGHGGALYWLIPTEIASLYLSIGNAWVFAIEIPRRVEVGRKNDKAN